MMERLSNDRLVLTEMAFSSRNNGTMNGNPNNDNIPPEQHFLGAVGPLCATPRNGFSNDAYLQDFIPPSVPQEPTTTAAKSKNTVTCNICSLNASFRCMECNEFFCNGCIKIHCMSNLNSSSHSINLVPDPIGTSPMGTPHSGNSPSTTPLFAPGAIYLCVDHTDEVFRYVCEQCNKLVCQQCTFNDHKDHVHTSIESYVEKFDEKIKKVLDSSDLAISSVKTSIDRALVRKRKIESNFGEVANHIQRSFQQIRISLQNRERYLFDCMEKIKQRQLISSDDKSAGLKSALAGLAENAKAMEIVQANAVNMDPVDLAMSITNGRRQLEQFVAIYPDLQPKDDLFVYASNDVILMTNIMNYGSIVVVDETSDSTVNLTGGCTDGVLYPIEEINTVTSLKNSCVVPAYLKNLIYRRNTFASSNPNLPENLNWLLSANNNPVITSAIPGTSAPVRVRKSNSLTLSFATEGHRDGEVCRPWGLFVDKLGHILVSDRRNNRVQVFYPNGALKFKIGSKGNGDGEFDLPAGICVDVDNRIIVVDKDNHRVQIFNSYGKFLLKFGSFGKEYSQFQYPWDVAVNSKSQIVVTDSRNHRIQQFDAHGRFLRQIVLEGQGVARGMTSPRGVCYTPQNLVVVSDFDNHCLYLVDPEKNKVVSFKGREGYGVDDFSRPSGICCDDEGRIIVADSKNQRISVFTSKMEYMWSINIRPSINPLMPPFLDEKDRTCDVALMPDGRVAFLIELAPDYKDSNLRPRKHFVYIF